jgi:co-chaperonin GroES (HSP10)
MSFKQIIPLLDRVLVRVVSSDYTSIGGILLSPTFAPKILSGEVRAIGTQVKDVNCKHHVLFDPKSAVLVDSIDGKLNLYIIKIDEILAIVD